jgi:hypothetical protein
MLARSQRRLAEPRRGRSAGRKASPKPHPPLKHTMTIMTLLNRINRELARRRLAQMVEAKRNSFEIRDFAKRRTAALKFTRRAEG